MPSLRKKVTTYFRQLSFIADRDEQIAIESKISEGSFITRYLDGTWKPPNSIPAIVSGKEPAELPEHKINEYKIGPESVVAAYTGPDQGLTGIRRKKVHLSAGPEIDFIDTQEQEPLKSCYKVDGNANKRSFASCRENSIQGSSKSTDNKRHFDNALSPGMSNSNKKVDCNNENTIIQSVTDEKSLDPIANIKNWNIPDDHAYGISLSLYEKNAISGESIGNPVADCFGIIARKNTCIMAVADGVNWGEGARLAARCAIQGSIDYLNSAIFGFQCINSTKDIFISLIRSFWEAHAYIMETGGALTTLTVLVVLPLQNTPDKYVACCCNVGDSFGYVYSKTNGVREITEGSHDVNSMRDMRDALGALGPVNGGKPEMNNLTLSLTILDKHDIVFLTSDGISDNFDPVVGKFAEPLTHRNPPIVPSQPRQSSLTPKRQNKSSSCITPNQKVPTEPINKISSSMNSTRKQQRPPPSVSKDSSVDRARLTYTRSKTFIEPRMQKQNPVRQQSSLPLVSGAQRHQLTMLRMADILMYGINGILRPCNTAKQLCQLLIDFATHITSAKRNLLEQRELYYKISIGKDGRQKEVEFTKQQQKVNRKRMTDGNTFASLPGKLDHATIVAYTVGVEHSSVE